MKPIPYIIALCTVFLPCAATAQQSRMFSADKNNEYGIVYNLPETVLEITLQSTTTHEVPGPFYPYAKRYLGIDNPVMKPTSSIQLSVESLSVTSRPGKQKYLMQLKPGAVTQLCLSPNGTLLAINEESNLSAEAALAESASTVTPPDINEYLQYVDADYLASLSTPKQAQMLAQTLLEIRDSRLALSRGTAETMPADGRQLELMLLSLETQEKAIARAFTGYTCQTRDSRVYTYIPDSLTSTDPIAIATVDKTGTLLDTDNSTGHPVYITFSELDIPGLPLDAKGMPKALPKDAVVYNIPATATATVIFRGKQLALKQIPVTQWGIQFGLDPKLFTDKRAPSCAIFDEVTGALISISELK